MKKIIFTILFIYAASFISKAVVISHFTFDNEPITQAELGFDALSVSSLAASNGDGVYVNSFSGFTGLNLELPASLPLGGSLSLEFVFTINESHGYIFEKEGFRLWINAGYFHLRFQTTDGSSFTSFNYPNIYALPPVGTRVDVLWTYDEISGKASLYVYGNLVWEEVGVPGESLIWYYTDPAVIGRQLNGGGSTTPLFYDFKIYDNVKGDGSLPVELLEFNAIVLNEAVELEWSTATETQNDYFEVQRSVDGTHFDVVGFVGGNGNSNQLINYSYSDLQVDRGTYYYRLRQVDYDGAFEYSPMRSVMISESSGQEVNVFPNPLPAGESLRISVPDDKEILFRIFDVSGKLIYEEINQGANLYSLPDVFVHNAVYLIETVQGNKRQTRRLIVR